MVITMAGTLVVLLACLPLLIPMLLSCIYVLTSVSYWLEEKKNKEVNCLVVINRPFIVFLSELVYFRSAVMGNIVLLLYFIKCCFRVFFSGPDCLTLFSDIQNCSA